MDNATTEVTVFVDDAVLGRLPRLCASTGQPCDGTLTVHADVGRSWSIPGLVILLLAMSGPTGWVVLLFGLAFTPLLGRGERLTVQLPWCAAVEDDVQRLRRRRRSAWIVVVAGMVLLTAVTYRAGIVLAPALSDAPVALTLLAVSAVAGAVAVVTHWHINRRSVAIELDASRRWVTLGNVHPAFRAAVEAQAQPHDARRP